MHPITSYKFLQGLQNELAYSTIEAQDGIFNGNLIVNGRIQDKGILPADINWDNIAPGNYYVTNTSFSTNLIFIISFSNSDCVNGNDE